MLVVTANWAISDGSVAAPPRLGLFTHLGDEIGRAAVRAGFRRDGRYRPVDRVVLVLAGDTFDGVGSDRWLGSVRPWERRREAVARHADVFRSVWRQARRPLAAIARLARQGVRVPAAGRHGRPEPAARTAVPVQVVILAGDRDAAIERFVGDASRGRRGIGIGSVWDGADVRVLHGAECDPLGCRDDGPTLLESMAVDLVARFGAALAARPSFRDRGRALVRMLADGQPLDMPLRLRAALPTAVTGAGDETWVADTWRRSVERWAREARRWGCDDGHGNLEATAAWMHALGGVTGPQPAIRAVISALASPLPFGGGARRLTVAGHPGPSRNGDRDGVVCLGPPSIGTIAAATPRTGAVACVETGLSLRPARLPAVAIFEQGEGGGRELSWLAAWDPAAWDTGGPGNRPDVVPILDAA